jgi:DNA-binding CsgD family transcriptional regulator
VKYGKGKPNRAAGTTCPPAIPYPLDMMPLLAEEPDARLHFTATEKRVGGWLAEGKSDPEIAGILEVGPETVRTHVKSLREKTGAGSRNELFAWIWRDRVACLEAEANPGSSGKYS